MSAQPTLKHLYESILRRHASAPAISFDDQTVTYDTLDAQSARLANALVELGHDREDRVGVLMSNRPEYAVADIALARAGLAKVPLNDMLGPDDIEYMLANSDATTVIAGPNFVNTVRDIVPAVPTLDRIIGIQTADQVAETAEYHQFEALLDAATPSTPDVAVTADTLAGVFHTGGTTGDPKGVKHTQENLVLNAHAHALELNIQPRDKLLLMTPLPHSAGLILAGGLTQGSHHVVTQGFDAERALRLIEQRDIAWTFMVPTMVYRLLDTLDGQSFDTASLETLVYGAAPMKPDRLREGLDKLGDVFVQLYGQYETPDLITVLPKTAHDPADEQRLSSCGLPTAMCEVKVVDDDGEAVPPGQPGEILARGAYSMTGYYELPEVTAETMDDGWIKTGDIGKRDEDGYLYIVDRDADVIISGGMNVYSVTVEDVVQQHEQVANVAVIGIPDDEWGEAVTAVVVPEGDTIDRTAIRSFCADRLADYEVPKTVEVVDELPTTPYGKIDKKQLREPYWEDETREVS
ncbi:long-chain-fatty-acid--CoA ligase [Halorientalis regularis]|uniref:Fatty-acyl-CoA synthase/long-chain acyl-CoA synthetase n=1 Tax=Halorientalis regularis TaxID=660518 RepID=A0A1G7QEE4_9EURY|nr:long-chain-fatty-acid--CoA ligase [Halorientalis regularis]SDF96913.1 fatty-acyl-CoA synthase/long-chain acyl-CoA synthetase [Halorientalis regularis]